MLVESSLANAISLPLCFFSEHGKQQNLEGLFDWLDYGKACRKSSKCHHDECKRLISAGEKDNCIISNPIAFRKTHSDPTLTEDMGETFALDINDHVYKRRKNDITIDLSSFSGRYDGVLAPIVPKEFCETDLVDKGKATLCRQQCPQNPNVSEVQITDPRNPDIVSNSMSMKIFLASMRVEYGESGKSSSFDVSTKSIGKSQSENELYNSNGTTDSLNVWSVDEDASYSQFCILCAVLDNTSKMLICDLCEEAFHMSCCNPQVRKVPIDEWYCRPCMKKKPKPLVGAMTASKPEIPVYNKASLILSMLKDTEPYTPRVRIGQAFQADVPDWSGPISKDPLSEAQTDDWDCSCSVFLDPVHSGCAVPQEPETKEILTQLKYVKSLRPRLSKRHRLNPIKGVGSR